MPPRGKPKSVHRSRLDKFLLKLKGLSSKYFTKEFGLSLVFDPQHLPLVGIFLILGEIFVNIVIVRCINYTEIDWRAYMQEVEGVINGTFDYAYLKGDTGPLVYPAGFVYIYTALYYMTSHGLDIRRAQYIFALFYIIILCLVIRIYSKSKKVPPYVLVLTCCFSYRIHSIFVLRLFNDTLAVLLLYLALNLFLENKWTMGSIIYSLAVSVKMNILLFAPALLLVYITSQGIYGTLKQLSICAAVQLFLGLPFLIANPVSYIRGAFDFGRVFLYKWTVNWKCIPEDIFVNPYFHISLLIIHILILGLLYKPAMTFLHSYATFVSVEDKVRTQLKGRKEKVDTSTASRLLLQPLFVANFVGIVCSRSLHYQFYVWYFHSLPYLLWCTPYKTISRLLILGIIELCWNTYPSTLYSSLTLHICHVLILTGIYRNWPTKVNKD